MFSPLVRVLRYSCLLFVLSACLAAAPRLQAGIILPSGLHPGDHFQLIFVTSDGRDALSSNISDYNAFVTTEAAPITTFLNGLGYTNVGWTAIASTSHTAALSNAHQFDTVYDTQGHEVADTSSDHSLYGLNISRTLFAAPKYDQQGQLGSQVVWTGAEDDGGIDPAGPLGSSRAGFGDSRSNNAAYLDVEDINSAAMHSFYGLSGELTVPQVASVPEPQSIILAALGVVGAWGYRRRCNRSRRSGAPVP